MKRTAYEKTYYRGTRLKEIYDGANYGTAGNTAPLFDDNEHAELASG